MDRKHNTNTISCDNTWAKWHGHTQAQKQAAKHCQAAMYFQTGNKTRCFGGDFPISDRAFWRYRRGITRSIFYSRIRSDRGNPQSTIMYCTSRDHKVVCTPAAGIPEPLQDPSLFQSRHDSCFSCIFRCPHGRLARPSHRLLG